MIDLNKNFSDPLIASINEKLCVILHSISIKDTQYKVIFRSLVGGYQAFLIPPPASQNSHVPNFYKQAEIIKTELAAEVKKRGLKGIDWNCCIGDFSRNSCLLSQKDDINNDAMGTKIWCFVIAFMELYPKETFIDEITKTIFIDKPLHGWIVSSTDRWIQQEIEQLAQDKSKNNETSRMLN